MSSTRPERVAVEIDDRHAEGLDRGLGVRVDRVDEGAGLDAGREDRAGAEQLELQAVEEHPPADALPVVAVAGRSPSAMIGTSGWSIRFSPTPGRSAMHGDAVLAQLVGRADAGQHEELAA